MAFSDFKSIAEVQQKYNIKYQEGVFVVPSEVEPPEHFWHDLEFYKENMDVFSSEASRSEIVISPLLRELYKKCYTRYSLWIQKSMVYDAVLSGTPDYIISGKSELGKTVLGKPIVIVVEAKKNDFEQGWGQCLAELVAAQYLNGDRQRPVYGIVTDGNLWQFGKLETDTFTKNSENFLIDKLAQLYGALDYLLGLIEV